MSEVLNGLPTKDQFSEHIDSTFRALLDGGRTMDLQLFKLETGVSSSFQESFSLLFRAPLDAPPYQSMVHLEHDELGEMDLFLVPISRKDDHLEFQAVFNHLVG